ncbi:MAG: DNA mismatch repair protein MutS [Bdellovibrionales bacterium]
MTPLMKQYWEIKSAHPDKIVLFRMGDFYEMFHDDAITAAPILSIALTSRNKKAQDETPMCGMPHHSVAGPINKLLNAGHKVAICDQLEDPKQAKGIVKRGITRILTPGMAYDPDALANDRPNYIAAFDDQEVSFVDSSTGEAFFFLVKPSEKGRILELISPKEIVCTEKQKVLIESWKLEIPFCFSVVTDERSSQERLTEYIQQALPSFETQSLVFEQREFYERMRLSPQVLRHLEIFETYHGEKKGSLFWAIDRTRTSLGARKLRNWLAFPLVNEEQIQYRQNQIAHWASEHTKLQRLREQLMAIGDIERRVCKFYLPACGGRDLLSLMQSTAAAVELLHEHKRISSKEFQKIYEDSQEALKALAEDLPLSPKEGGIFKKGYNEKLDEYIDLTSNLQEKLLQIEARERESTKISSLKVKYNNVFGFFIELTKTHAEKAPSYYMRKQTLSTGERFTTEELNLLEQKILSARTQRLDFEFELFVDFKKRVLERIRDYLVLAGVIAELDVFSSLAWLSNEQKYVRPELTNFHDEKVERNIRVQGLRHPVVEQLLAQMQKTFVANDVDLSVGHGILLTGPNMAGKSTVMRQVACAVLMAQIGSFIPAATAKLPIFESLWTRIGANDALSQGLSTFMVEMKETAEILKEAGPTALVILDEIGRGTSTFDGMSLAQAILEHLISEKRATLLFATHYHELTILAEKLPHLTNAHMEIRDHKGQMEFLYQLKPGPAGQSYGIQVGALAGLPTSVIRRAEQILHQFESEPQELTSQMNLFSQETKSEETRQESAMLGELKEMDISRLTPLEALVKISHWQEKLVEL